MDFGVGFAALSNIGAETVYDAGTRAWGGSSPLIAGQELARERVVAEFVPSQSIYGGAESRRANSPGWLPRLFARITGVATPRPSSGGLDVAPGLIQRMADYAAQYGGTDVADVAAAQGAAPPEYGAAVAAGAADAAQIQSAALAELPPWANPVNALVLPRQRGLVGGLPQRGFFGDWF